MSEIYEIMAAYDVIPHLRESATPCASPSAAELSD